MSQMQVTVPAGIGPGMPFLVNMPGAQMQVTCPEGVSAGGQMNITTAVVMAAPAPMQMAQAAPMQPVPMGTPALAVGTQVYGAPKVSMGAPWKCSIEIGNQSAIEAMKRSEAVPAARPALPRRPDFALLKGRGNYLCLNKIHNGTSGEPEERPQEEV